MESILGIFSSLGVNSTIWIQLGLFLTIYFVFNALVVKPYFNAYLIRQEKTVGSQEHANALTDQARELESAFQRKARELNQDIKEIYDQARAEALVEQNKIQNESRSAAKNKIESAREKLKDEYNRAREELLKEAAGVGQTIKERLFSRD